MKGIVINQGPDLSLLNVKERGGRMTTTVFLTSQPLRDSLRAKWECIRSADSESWNNRCHFGGVDVDSLRANLELQKDIEFIMPTSESREGSIMLSLEYATMEFSLKDDLFLLNKTYEYKSHRLVKVATP